MYLDLSLTLRSNFGKRDVFICICYLDLRFLHYNYLRTSTFTSYYSTVVAAKVMTVQVHTIDL